MNTPVYHLPPYILENINLPHLMSPFLSFASTTLTCLQTPDTCTSWTTGEAVADSCTQTQRHTKAAADISEELQRIQGVESHFVKEDQTAGNENHWPSLVTELTICAWNQLKEERKQRKLAGEGNVWASINRRPVFEMILKGMQSFIIQLILLHVYHIRKRKRNLTVADLKLVIGCIYRRLQRASIWGN